jgi:hypothetical protein
MFSISFECSERGSCPINSNVKSLVEHRLAQIGEVISNANEFVAETGRVWEQMLATSSDQAEGETPA